MDNWRSFKLGKVINLKRGYDLPQNERIIGKVPVISSSGITDYHNESKVKGPGVVTGRYGTIGTVFYSKEDFWPLNTSLYVQNFKGNEIKFIYYFLNNFDFEQFNDKSAVPGINRNHIHEAMVSIPPLPEQKAIASVLSSLDDKIDLLQRQNKTLEAMAETLFRQWFVEKAQEDWDERPLSGIADFLNGLACQKFLPKNEQEKLPVLKIKELRNGFSEESDWASTDVTPKYIVENGDIIFSWSASLIVKIWDDQRCILNQHLFKVTSETFPKWFYYQWCKYHLAGFVSISTSHATTMGHIKRNDLDTAMVLVPTETELGEMTLIFNPIISKIIENNKQIRTLEKLRDTLLPKLMSGEVRVAFNDIKAM